MQKIYYFLWLDLLKSGKFNHFNVLETGNVCLFNQLFLHHLHKQGCRQSGGQSPIFIRKLHNYALMTHLQLVLLSVVQ